MAVRRKAPSFVEQTHTAQEIGDEAQLLARHATTCVAREREEGARLIFQDQETDCLIMDDGYQNPSLVKDFSVLLVDAETGFGNGAVFPSGPLRETPAAARVRADAIVFVVPDETFEVSPSLMTFAEGKPVFRAWLSFEPAKKPGRKVLAFCGIGRPEKFYRTARAAGYDIVETRDFSDHYQYQAKDLEVLDEQSALQGADLLTTEKDHVRLPAAYKSRVGYLPVAMQIDNEPDFLTLMLSDVKRRNANE